MCDSPIYIENKNKLQNKRFIAISKKRFPWKDVESDYLQVPCGHCQSCVRKKQDSLVQRVQMESSKNHLFMCTLTYSPEALPYLEVNNRRIAYADSWDVQKMIKMLRKYNAFGIPFRTLCVSELGSKRGRPHFHILFMFPKSYFPENKDDYISSCDAFASKNRHYFTVLKYWRKNYSENKRVPEWHPCTRYKEKWINGQLRKNYDFHYVNPFLTKNGVEDCGYYVLKYMFKPSDRAVRLQQALRLNLVKPGEKSSPDYEKIWSIIRPRCFKCIGFGFNAKVQLKEKIFEKDSDIIDKLISDIDYSLSNLDYPAYSHPFTGKMQVVSQYYLKDSKIYPYEVRKKFWNKKNLDPGSPDIVPESQKESITIYLIKSKRYENTQNYLDDVGIDADFDLLD